MKRVLLAALAWVMLAVPVAAQWQVPDHAVPIGRGSGTGFKSAAPGAIGGTLTSNGASADPSFRSGVSLDLRSYAVSPKTPDTVCNGSGDDTATIQAALDASGGGQTIVFPAGECLVSSPGLDIKYPKQNVKLLGQGAGTSSTTSTNVTKLNYISSSGSLVDSDGVNGLEISNMTLGWNHASYTGRLINLGRAQAQPLFTHAVHIHDCAFARLGSGGAATSIIDMTNVLDAHVDHCFFDGGVQSIEGGANSNSITITNNWFNQDAPTTSHIGVMSQGWTIKGNVFEPTAGTVTNNIIANGAINGLLISGNTFNDGATGTLINLSGAVAQGVSIIGNQMQGGNVALNLGSAVGVDVSGNSFLSNDSCNVLVSSSLSTSIGGNYNPSGFSICSLPSGAGTNLLDAMNGTGWFISPTLGFLGSTSGNTKVKASAVAGSGTWTIPSGSDDFAGRTATQTLTNKTISGANNTLSGPIVGTATNDSAAAGRVGEYIESVVAQGSAISLTTATAATVTSISLTAGDWDVRGIVNFSNNVATSVTLNLGSLSLVNNTLDSTAGRFVQLVRAATTGVNTHTSAIPPYRFSLSGTTTIFLIARQDFTVNTGSAWGIISARRVR